MWSKLTGTLAALLAAAAMLCIPVLAAEAEETEALPEAGEAEQVQAPQYEVLFALKLRREGTLHAPLVRGYADGSFRPDAVVTRAEAVQMLYCALADCPEADLEFADAREEDWYYPAFCTLCAGGVIVPEDGSVRPNESVTRGEFAEMLACFAPDTKQEQDFSDISAEDPLAEKVSKTVAAGWYYGYEDGTFRPEQKLTRAEATAVMNRVLHRSADEAIIEEWILSPFTDVDRTCWAYEDILEASLEHMCRQNEEGERWEEYDISPLKREPGLCFVGLEQYDIGEDGFPVTDTTVGTLYYGPDGRYTSGNEELDAYAKNVLSVILTAGMTREEQLHAAFLYTRDSFTYLRRNYYALGDNSYTEQEALTMFSTGRGNCYCFAGVFYYLSRQLGYDSVAVSGVVGHDRSPHGWVEIVMDGVTYIYDTELEMAYREKGVYYYDFYHMSYSRAPWPYVK